ncbi:DUF5988 family protein [Streptomyces sp. SBT349]|uniref:DUF5988 family protein n=1 Tax=Streptomyces sp. SBT349 TaxID=1580539 RepID=UPI001F353B3B|nr:DUF5988 family protein [Streptomyces sp. SBT349]
MIMDDNGAPNVFLSGGSRAAIADEERLCYLPDLDVAKVSVLRGNCYEHFEASSETTLVDGRELRVFVWTRRTYVAE